jgi:hypothetical protein
MLLLWLDIRLWLWRVLGVPLPAKDGWKALVQQVAEKGVYQDASVIGAPLAWCLLARDAEGHLQAVETTCAVSGVSISSVTPLADGKADVSNFGVRCARCGVPIHFRHAGMKTVFDVPSCPPCRRAVRRVKDQA